MSLKGIYFKRATAWILSVIVLVTCLPSLTFGDIKVYATEGYEVSTNKTEYLQGEAIIVTAKATDSNSWVGLYKKGETPSESTPSLYWAYTREFTSGANILTKEKAPRTPVPLEVGQYTVVLFKDGGYSVDQTLDITVKAKEGVPPGGNPIEGYELSTDKTEYIQGEAVVVTAKATDANSWVGLYKKGDVPGPIESFYWAYTGEFNSGADILTKEKAANRPVPVPLEVGEYTVVLFKDGNYEVVKTLDITVKLDDSGEPATDAIETTKDVFEFGEAITVKGTNSAEHAGAWLEIYDENFGPGTDTVQVGYKWAYTPFSGNLLSANSGYAVNRLPAGNYRIMLVVNDKDELGNYKTVMSKSITVKPRTFDLSSYGLSKEEPVKMETVNVASAEGNLTIVTNSPRGLADSYISIFDPSDYQNKELLYEYLPTTNHPDSSMKKDKEKSIWTFNTKTANLEAGKTYVAMVFEAGGWPLTRTEFTIAKNKISYVGLEEAKNPIENPYGYNDGDNYEIKSLVRDGYIFEGWYKDENFAGDTVTSTEGFIGDVTLYAKWMKVEKYKINYVLNGGENAFDNPQEYINKENTTLKPISKAGYTFEGWFYDAAFTQDANTIVYGTVGDVTVYAKFTKKESTTEKYRIETSVINGSIEGDTKISKGGSYKVEYSPNSGYALKKILVDGKEVDLTTYKEFYEFKDIQSHHTIEVIYSEVLKVDSLKLSYEKATYTGKSIKPPVLTIKNHKGDLLVNKRDYDVTGLTDKKSVGTYKVTVTFKGDYTGTRVLYFTIVPKVPSKAEAILYGPSSVKFSWNKATGASGYYVYYKKSTAKSYTYLMKTTGTYVKKSGLTNGVKYYFKVVPYYYSSSNKASYKSDGYRTDSIYTLKKVSTPKIYKSGTKVKVKWENISGESGYQISKSTKKTGTSIVSTYQTTTGTYRIIDAKKGQTYYYKVRAYKVVDGKRIYGQWSNVKAYKR